ncbi:MAG TPA: ATP-binding protein, partial [Chondromyces sp.]|nr:ATP-binding protein [Chondromyces sp.]
YRLRILLDDGNKHTFGLRINKLNNASAIYVNGQRIGKSGQVATTEDQHKGSNIPFSVSFKPNRNEIDLVIQVSSNRNNGGIAKPIRFGTEEAIHSQTFLSEGLQLLLCVVLLLHSIYAIILYFIRPTLNKGLLYFSLLLICAIVSVLGSDDKLLFKWISVEYNWEVKITFLSYIGVGAFIPLIINRLFPKHINKWALRYFIVYCVLDTLFVLIASPRHILQFSKVLLLGVLLLSIIISTIGLRKAKIDKDESIFLILGCLSIGVNIIWATFKSNTSLEMMHYPFDLIFALLCFAAFWFKRFFRIASEAKELAGKLQLENKRKDEFLVNTSHELRNPLYGITNIIQTLLEDKTNPLNEDHQKPLSILLNISRRMSLLLNDLLDVTRLKEKTIQLHLERINIQSVVTGVLDMFKLMVDGKPIRIQVEIPDTFPAVVADENRLIQILFNLIHNAVKFTDEGIITIRATIDNQMARLHIEDTGIGIEEDELQRIFEPYEQTIVNSQRASGGFGLGLSICKQLVELHQGTLNVQSTPGKGSIFTFTLPLYKGFDRDEDKNKPIIVNESSDPIAVTTEMPYSGDDQYLKRKLKILAVDDDPVNLNILITILKGNDYVITGVTNAYQAVEKLKTEHYDLVISDVMMPHVSGYELTRMIRERFSISELPVLLLTARTRMEDILTGFQSGANDYVTKPVDSWELKARVNALTKLKVSIEERIRIEGAWLQSQIQPHFIFNTLNSIAALGEVDISKMQELLEEFSHYLRLSFDFHNADPVVPLEQELSFVHSYLYIEKTRFGNRLMIEWELDADIDVLLPPLTIQPLVENAVKHGVLQNVEGGTILIQIKKQPHYIKVSVIDNGKGMKTEEISQLFKEKKSHERTSVGLRNVDRRLKQLYGKGLIIQSAPNHGTTVSFYVPK